MEIMKNEEFFDRQVLERPLIIEQQKNTMFLIVVSAAIVLLLGWYINISCDYPYYFMWDMDHVTTLDTVLIQSELLPDHIHHPGFGMYLPLFFSEKIAHFFSVLSALNLEQLSASLNPLASMAELTDFVRLHTPFLVIGIVLLLSISVYLISGLSCWYLLFFIVFLGTQESFIYHSSMIRSELYSVFYWSAAVLTIAAAAKAARPSRRLMSLLAAGVLLGLCFLTKVQSLIYLVESAVLLPLMFSVFGDEREENSKDIKPKKSYWILAVSFANVIVFLILAVAAYSVPVPQGIPTWSTGFGVTPMTILFFLVLLSLLLCQLFLCLMKRLSSNIFTFSSFFTIIAAGFLLTFALHFLLYSDLSLSLRYMLLDFKMVFLRDAKFLQLRDLPVYISNFLSYARYNPVLFIVNITLNLFLVLGCFRGFVRITKGQLALCLLATIVAYVNILIATRLNLHDILWKEVLLNFLNLLYFAILVSRDSQDSPILTRIGGGLLVVLFFVNCVHACNMPARIDANYNHYGWQQDKWLTNPYGGNQQKYGNIMRAKYSRTTATIAQSKAVDHRQIRKTVDFVFKNQTITHRNIGIAFNGFPAWSADLDYKLVEVPAAVKGAILVDNASIKPGKRFFFKEEYVRQHSEYPDKFKKSSVADKISVLTRFDLKIFLFVHPDDVSGLVDEQIVLTPYKIVLKKSEQSIVLQGLEIKNYCEIPLEKITQKFFFVIRKG